SLFLWVVGYFILFYFPVHPDSRYKLPLLPYIMVFSAVGLVFCVGLIKSLLFKLRKARRLGKLFL
ncbi:MAG: hypothetical protein NTV62_00540, partial [Candidatus Gribaldobacteria bacterium]|nr:hypothetical protein [Candidatus Gribaldobacteria bacterium]